MLGRGLEIIRNVKSTGSLQLSKQGLNSNGYIRQLMLNITLANSAGTGFTHITSADWYPSASEYGIDCFAIGDFNGDGLDDIIGGYEMEGDWEPPPHNHLWVRIAKEDANGFQGFFDMQWITSYELGLDYRIREIQTGDFNSDGRDDLAIRISHKSDIDPTTDNEFSCDIQFSTLLTLNTVDFVRKGWLGYLNRFYIGNFTNSKNQDLLVFNDYCQYYYWDDVNQQLARLPQDYGYPSKYHDIFPGDYNGDGLTDIITCSLSPNFYWELTFSTGAGGTWPTIPIDFLPPVDPNRWYLFADYKFWFSDFNGDGKTDILEADRPNDLLKFYYSKGDGTFFDTPENYNIEFYYVSLSQFRNNDFNGDGKAEILHIISLFDSLNIIQIHPNEQRELVHSITNGFGNKIDIEHSSLSGYLSSSFYNKKNTTFQETDGKIKDFQGPLHVVKKTGFENGLGGTLTTNYTYEHATIHPTGMGFLGFEKITAHDQSSGIKKIDIYSSTVPELSNSSINFIFPHIIKSQQIFNENIFLENECIVKGYQFYNGSGSPKDKIIFPVSELINTKEWEITDHAKYIKTSRTRSYYNATDIIYGNPTKITTLNDPGEINISSSDNLFTFKEEINRTYYPYDEANWVIGNINLTTTQTFIKDHGSQTKTRQFVYYLQEHEHSQLLWKDIISPTIDPFPADLLSIITEYDYDQYANIKKTILSAPNASPPTSTREMNFENDPNYQSRFVTKTTDPLQHFTLTEYDALTGMQTTSTDINNLTTEFSKTIFGTYSKTIAPDQTQNMKVFRWVDGQSEAPPNALYYSWEKNSGSSEVLVFYDKLGRVLRQVTKGFNNDLIFTDQHYDGLGRLIKTSDPYFNGDTPVYTENKYNTTLPRVDYIIFTDQTEMHYTYNGLATITTNEAGQAEVQKKNAIGLMDESTDANSKTIKSEYSYENNNLINTIVIQQHPETQTTIKIDKFGNRFEIIDPSSGTITETHNAFGELISSTDQKQIVTSYTYDLNGRMISRNVGGELTTWLYDNKPHGIGLLDKTYTNVNTVEYFYDELSRVKQKDETITGEEDPFSFTYVYDSYSRTKEQKYPSGVNIRNHYLENGYLYKITEVSNGIKELWRSTVINAKNQIQTNKLGNIITTDYSFKTNTDYLSSIHTVTGTNVLQDLEYQWDDIGNMTSRKKWIDRSQSLYLEESFGYDNLNRLTTINVNGQNTYSMIYDDLGNITEKTPLTTMNYGGVGLGPYAVSSVAFPGEEAPANEQNITYTVFDKIHTIYEGTATLVITYGVDHERIKQVIQKDGEDYSKKVYIGGLCEKITDERGTRLLNFIDGPQGVFAIIVKQPNGEVDINYILKDHLGSLTGITDESGVLLEELSFDAWGRRRNPTNWTFTGVPATYIYDRGFTGHEHLDLFGLINMNGRAYDPLVGRFLSTDAFVQAPDFTQSYNRYSYCVNNPLKYSDPSGQIFGIDDIVIGAFIGMTINCITQLATNHNLSMGDFWLCGAVGAVSGVASGGVGAGVSAALSVATPFTSALNGALVGAASGFTGGFIIGAHNSWMLNDADFGQGLIAGLIGGGYGALGGALMGGISGGIDAYMDGRNFLDGGPTVETKLEILLQNKNPELMSEVGDAGVSDVKVGTNKNLKGTGCRNAGGKIKDADGEVANGLYKQGKAFDVSGDGYVRFNDNKIYLSKQTVRQMWRGDAAAKETLFHEWYHARDYYTGYADYLYRQNPKSYTYMLEFRAHSFNYSRLPTPARLNFMEKYSSLYWKSQ